jgi:hypothetical protein
MNITISAGNYSDIQFSPDSSMDATSNYGNGSSCPDYRGTVERGYAIHFLLFTENITVQLKWIPTNKIIGKWNLLYSDIPKVELLNYTVETYGATSPISSIRTKLGNGFIHNSTYNYTWYSVNGTIKNIAGYTLELVIITVNFLDKNDTLLLSEKYTVTNLAMSITADFGVSFESDHPNFNLAEKVGFEFTAS